jgi:hypothetical protein
VKTQAEEYVAWAKRNPDDPLVASVERELRAIYANLRLSDMQRVTLVANVLVNAHRLMLESGVDNELIASRTRARLPSIQLTSQLSRIIGTLFV